MAVSGDLQIEDIDGKIPSIRLNAEIHFTSEGLVLEEPNGSTNHQLSHVIQVVDGDIDSVLPLIGYRMLDIKNSLSEDNVFKGTEEVKELIKGFGPRSPGSYIVADKQSLYGVTVDHKNNCRLTGRVTSVVPESQPSEGPIGINVVVVGKEGVKQTIRSTDFDLRDKVYSGITFCIVSERGFAFVETNCNQMDEEIPSLTLILSRGYILFEEVPIDWIRLQVGLKIGEFAARKTTIELKECFVSLHGGYVREDDRVVLYGSQNSVIDFDSFNIFLREMETIVFETEHLSDRLENQTIEDNSPTDSVEEEPQISPKKFEEIVEELSDSYDSFYDNISPDSFS